MNIGERKSDGEDNYADWLILFEEMATSDRSFDEDVKLNHDVMDKLYDNDLSVAEALKKYLELV